MSAGLASRQVGEREDGQREEVVSIFMVGSVVVG